MKVTQANPYYYLLISLILAFSLYLHWDPDQKGLELFFTIMTALGVIYSVSRFYYLFKLESKGKAVSETKYHVLLILVFLFIVIIRSSILTGKEILEGWDYLSLGTTVMLFLAIAWYNIRKFKFEKMGLPIEDEMSKTIFLKAQSVSWTQSQAIWFLAIMLIVDQRIDADTALIIGPIGSVVALAITYLYYKRNGVKLEEQD